MIKTINTAFYANCFALLSLLLYCQTDYGQIKNIKISSLYEPEEVSIAINPKNKQQIIAGANLASAYFSHDGGNTWQRNTITCNQSYVYGDPMVFWDTTQNAYFMHLSLPNTKVIPNSSWLDRIVVNKSNDFGATYPICYGFGKNAKKVQDKHWACVDKKTNTIHVTWTQFDVYESDDKKDTSIIRYSNSKDGGITWQEPKKISAFTGDCLDSDNTVEGATPCIGPNGEIYVVWAGPKGLVFQKSLDGGEHFMQEEKIITPIKNGWDYNVSGLLRSNGLPFSACDISNSPYKGRIYACWSDEKSGNKNKDVFLVYSDDKGESWTDPILVTYHPNHKEQFMPFMTLDQTSGNIYILYYDRQNYLDSLSTDVYLAVSKNGGLKFDTYKVNEKPFKPTSDVFFGDYIGLSAVNKLITPIWMQMNDKKELNIYTAIINDSILNNYYSENANEIITDKMVSFGSKIKVNYSATTNSNLSVAIYKPLDSSFEKIVFSNSKIKKGKHQFTIDTQKLKLNKDNYVLTLYFNNKNYTVWITNE